MSRNHDYKCWPYYFQQIWLGNKRFEIRESRDGERGADGRAYHDPAVGDTVILREYDGSAEDYTGRGVQVTVLYVMDGGRFGLAPEHLAFGFRLDVCVGGAEGE